MSYWDQSALHTNTSYWSVDATALATRIGSTDISHCARGLASHSTGKHYFELGFTTGSSDHNLSDIGIVPDAHSANQYPGQTGSWGYINGSYYTRGTNFAVTIAEPTTDCTYGLLLDLDNGKAWLVIEGVIYGDTGQILSVSDVESGTAPGWDDAANLAGTEVFPATCMNGNDQTATLKLTDAETSSFVLPAGYDYWTTVPAESVTLDGFIGLSGAVGFGYSEPATISGMLGLSGKAQAVTRNTSISGFIGLSGSTIIKSVNLPIVGKIGLSGSMNVKNNVSVMLAGKLGLSGSVSTLAASDMYIGGNIALSGSVSIGADQDCSLPAHNSTRWT